MEALDTEEEVLGRLTAWVVVEEVGGCEDGDVATAAAGCNDSTVSSKTSNTRKRSVGL